jgi:hypothetical protein
MLDSSVIKEFNVPEGLRQSPDDMDLKSLREAQVFWEGVLENSLLNVKDVEFPLVMLRRIASTIQWHSTVN